jgi:uncharacterized protein (DUF2141 family)
MPLLFALLITYLLPMEPPVTASLQVRLRTSQAGKGDIHLAVYASQRDFDNRANAVFEAIRPLERGADMVIEVPALPEGRYAIAAFHDLNGNGKLDVNAMGIPQEPYAFSRNPRAKWKAPAYDEVVFSFNRQTGSISLSLQGWSER